MKRLLFVFLLSIGTLSLCAQTYSLTNIDLKSERVKKKNVYEKEQFIMLDYSYYSEYFESYGPKGSAFGVRYGQVKLFGWYANFMLGTGMHYGYDGRISGYDAFYTGKYSNNYLSLSGGALFRVVIPLYIYAGVGYAYQSVTRETTGLLWVLDYHDSLEHSALLEVGLQGNIKGFTLSAGVNFCVSEHDDIMGLKFGIGYTFKTK